MTMETITENKSLKLNPPVPLDPPPLLQRLNEGQEIEKNRYWNSILTGNTDTVPDAVRRKAGVADETAPAEERDYRLMSNINRSWVVDFKNVKKEEVRANWPGVRRNLAKELGVRDSEHEIYTALSMQQQDAPRHQELQNLFEKSFYAGLKGEQLEEAPGTDDPLGVGVEAYRLGSAQRSHYMPLAEAVSGAWRMLKATESLPSGWGDLLQHAPDMVEAIDEMAILPLDERARVYEVARTLESTRELEDDMPTTLGGKVLAKFRRGTEDLKHSMLQGAGHLAVAVSESVGKTMDSDILQSGAEKLDKRLQVLHELRSVAQGEIMPIKLSEDSSFMAKLALEAAGAVPHVSMAFMGSAGFGALTLSGFGDSVAEARLRSPEGRHATQTAAGLLAGGIQAGIYNGMSKMGSKMLSNCINRFAKARNAGAAEYSLAALKSVGAIGIENAKLLVAGKAAQVSEMGLQELAARLDNVASNIDWESFGNNLVDAEENMREAAMNLPFILIAAGRASLHHFRSPESIVDNRRFLNDWGVDEATQSRIRKETNIHVQSDMLREALYSSKRWGGFGSLELFIRSLKLLNTGSGPDFRDAKVARDFLNLEADVNTLMKPTVVERDLNNPAVVKELYARVPGPKQIPSATSKYVPYLKLWDEWSQLGQGVVPMPHAELKQVNKQYMEVLKDKWKGVPYYLRLDGYYHPYQEESLRVLTADRTREILDNSYRLLMNVETPTSLMNSYNSIEEARQKTEGTRRMYVSEFCKAMMRCVNNGMSVEDSFKLFNEQMEKFYLNRRRGARHAPRWLHQTSEATIREVKDKAYTKMRYVNKKDSPQLQEMYRSLVSARVCGESLLELLPHTRDFQTLLSMGYKPEEAYSHLMQREFNGHVDDSIWNPVKLNRKMANVADNIRRLDKSRNVFENYMALSGYKMEATTDGNGKELLRIKCPDGRYSPWMKGAGHVVNNLVGNVQISFLPTGLNLLTRYMQDAYSKDAWSKKIFERRRLIPLTMKRFVGFDHLGNTAARDLCSLWLGDSTQYGVGLEFSLHDEHWKHYKGKKVNAITKEIEPDSGMYLVRHGQVITPLDLVKTRFTTYWNRMLISGWVTPQEVGQALVENKSITQKELDSIIAIGTDRRVNFTHMSRLHRREFIKKNGGPFFRGDRGKMNRILAEHMTDLNLEYMLANLESAPLPNTVKQWFLTTPFSEFREPENVAALRHEKTMHANRTAANEVKFRIPRVVAMREALKQGRTVTLENMMRNAYTVDERRRYEQGWCYAMGGAGAFRAAGQSFWNLLEDPARAWNMLPEERRTELSSEIQDLCGDRPVEQALQELSAVLKEYPALHGYGVETRGGSDINRMVLDPVNLQNPTHPVFLKYVDARYGTPILVRNGFTLEKAESLPEECAADARVMPAIRLLTELRRQVTDIPFTDDAGIWWKNNRYGGTDGMRPGGLNEDWQPENALKPMLEVFEQLSERCQDSDDEPLEVCGVRLGGLRPGDIDIDKLKYVTVYRCNEYPEHMVRLMPGEPDADNPRQRTPYVLHSADGIPLLPTRQVRAREEYLHAMIPLREFSTKNLTSYDYKTNKYRREQQVAYRMNELVSERTVSAERWKEGSQEDVDNLELFMQLFQDSRLSYFLASRHPETYTRGEALACELARLTLLAEIGKNRDQHIENLVTFCRSLRRNKEDAVLIQHVLNRVVSPYPDQYSEAELSHPEMTEDK